APRTTARGREGLPVARSRAARAGRARRSASGSWHPSGAKGVPLGRVDDRPGFAGAAEFVEWRAMVEKRIDPELCARLAREYGTPYFLYDAAVIRAQIAKLRAFEVIRYAQKALSNLHVLRLMRAEGVQVDAVSGGELERALRAGYTGGG